MVLGAGPEGQEVAQTPWEIIAGVRVDGLEETQDNPHVHGEQVQVTGKGDPEDGAAYGSNGQQHNFNWRGVLGGKTKRSRVGVVQLVDVLVERAVVQSAVEPVVPGVFHDEEDGDLVGHLEPGREGDTVVHAKVHGNGVEEPDLRELDGDVADKDKGSAVKLLAPRRNFLLFDCMLVNPSSVRPLFLHGGQMVPKTGRKRGPAFSSF